MAVALRDQGLPVQYEVAPDEGHIFEQPLNRLATLAIIERFLAVHLGGRYQEIASTELANRIRDMTVDLRTVRESPMYLSAKARRSLYNGDIDSAIRYFSRAIEIDPQFADGYVGLGLAFERSGDFKEGTGQL